MMQWQETAPEVWTASTADRVYTVTKNHHRWQFRCTPPPADLTADGALWPTLLEAQEEAEEHSHLP